ncbi:hypothetical protein SteCoe_17967 [Stentor coeruleus]|uniref:Uncharacterized protein n=1 Tax=Stentor coeruleus TaxID=5963 RepID=A0A1R2BY48_9CILI|nr:hypothetical protein SteCoe_17967 [Stentor coeruleus]
MGAGCCMKFNSQRIIQQGQTNEEKERAFEDLKVFYKSNKSSMNQKLKLIFKEICKTGRCESEVVNLNFVDFQKARAEYLQQIIPFFQNLKVLKLWKSRLKCEGLKVISYELGGLVSLEILSLEDNSLGSDGSMYLAEALTKLKNLKELWLQINNIGIIGAAYIADSLPKLKNLEKLGIDENRIENKGAIKVASSVKKLKNMKILGLGYNLLNDETCLNIITILNTVGLEKLIFSGNNVSEQSGSKMKVHMPKTLIIF